MMECIEQSDFWRKFGNAQSETICKSQQAFSHNAMGLYKLKNAIFFNLFLSTHMDVRLKNSITVFRNERTLADNDHYGRLSSIITKCAVWSTKIYSVNYSGLK